MPIYEYQCEACGASLEKLQKLSDPALKKCPECGKARLKKKISATSFRLKGTGWYETDFKTGNKKHGTGENDRKKDKSAAKPVPDKGAEKSTTVTSAVKPGKTGNSKQETTS